MDPVREFAVSRRGEVVELVGEAAVLRHMGISPEMSAAYDIMADDGVPPADAAKMAAAAERQWNQGRSAMTPEQFARHFVKLRKAVRGFDSTKRMEP
jgi:hypothetical protein